MEDLVQELAEEYRVEGFEEASEGYGHVSVFLSDAIEHEQSNSTRRVAKRVKRYTVGEAEQREQESLDRVSGKQAGDDESKADEAGDDGPPQIVVLASGNLGLIYGTRLGRRSELEEIESFYPGLLEGLAAHEGIGFLMVGSQKQGAVVIGDKGRYYLADDRIEGENPLAGFGLRAADHLRRENSFSNCPDILVNSFYRADTNEVAAFEELIGCHGGMGGYQTQPFLLYPAGWRLDSNEEIVGAAAVYHQLKSWLHQVKEGPKF